MNIVLTVGIIASLIGSNWAAYNKDNPEYWRVKGRSRDIQNVIQIISTLFFPGAYLLILFSSKDLIKNVIIILVLHFLIQPAFYGVVEGVKGYKLFKAKHRKR